MSLVFKRFQSSFARRTALVTGSSRGIGFSIAQELAKRGTNVVMLARNEELLQRNLTLLPTVLSEQSHSYISCDITNFALLEEELKKNQMVKNTSILINSAGISQSSLLIRTRQNDIDTLISTNLTAPVTLTKLMTRTLIANKPSAIINISSVLGRKGVKGTSIYSATKAGILGFTRSLAVELGPQNVRVNCVSPGLVSETDMGKGFHYDTAIGGDVPMKNVTMAVLGLIQNQSVTGQNIVVDNGYLC